MKTEQMQVKVSVAWWLKPYLYGVALMCAFTGREFDEDRVSRIINRALSLRIEQ